MKITTKQLNEIRIFETYKDKSFQIDKNTTEVEARLLLEKLRKEERLYYNSEVFKRNLKKMNKSINSQQVNSPPEPPAGTHNKYTPQEIEEFSDY